MNNPLDPTLRELTACGCWSGTTAETPAAIDNRPGLSAIAFRAGTHPQFKASLLAALSDAARPALAPLRTRDGDDFTIALLDGWAAVADVLSFYSERIANESYLRTATERRSVLELARAIGYELKPGVAAATWLAFTVEDAPGAPGYANISAGAKVQSIPGPDEKPQVYETLADLVARQEWNQWRAAQVTRRLPRLDDTTIALAGVNTGLKEGDGLLIIGEERRKDSGSERWDFRLVRKLETFSETDAKPAHTLVTFNRPLGWRSAGGYRRIPPAGEEPVRVFALRQRAAIFGYNAPDWLALSPDIKKAYYTAANLTADPGDWPGFTIFTPQSSQPAMLAMAAATRPATVEEVQTAVKDASQEVTAKLRSDTLQAGAAALSGAVSVAVEAVKLATKVGDDVKNVAETVANSVADGARNVLNQQLAALGGAGITKSQIEAAVQSIGHKFEGLRTVIGQILSDLTDPTAVVGKIITALEGAIDAANAADAIATEAKRLVGDKKDAIKDIIDNLSFPPDLDAAATAIIGAATGGLNGLALQDTVASEFTSALTNAGVAIRAVSDTLPSPAQLDLNNFFTELKDRSIDLAQQLLKDVAAGAEVVEKIRALSEQLLRAALTNAQHDIRAAADSLRTAALQAADAVAMDADKLRTLGGHADSAAGAARDAMGQLLGAVAAEFVVRVVDLAMKEAAKQPQSAESMARTAIDAADAAAKAVPWIIRTVAAGTTITAAGLAAGPLVGLAVAGGTTAAAVVILAAPLAALASGPAVAVLVGGLETQIIPPAQRGGDKARDEISAAARKALEGVTTYGARPPLMAAAAGDTIDLDKVYPDIMADDWVVVTDSDYEEVFRVVTVAEKSRTNFLLSAKTTRLQLEGEWMHLDSGAVRSATVYCRMEELLRAEPDHTPVRGKRVELDRLVSGIDPGRVLVVQGRRAHVRVLSRNGLALADAAGAAWQADADAVLAVIEPPDALDKRTAVLRWQLEDAAGRRGFAHAAPRDFEFVAAPDTAASLVEVAIFKAATASPDKKRTVLELTDDLANAYDPATVTILANVAYGTHGETVKDEVLGPGDASQPNQRFALRQKPLTYVPDPSPAGAASTLQVWVNDVKWQEVPNLYDRGPSERIFIARRADDGTVTVEFGNGQSGARLPTGPDNVRAVYRKGIGLEGRVKAGQLSLLLTRPLGVKSVTNPQEPSEPADPQVLADARRNAPRTVLTLGRVVSLQDYEDFARDYPGVAKALATWTWNEHTRGVLLSVLGVDGRVLPEDDDTVQRLIASLLGAGNPLVPVRVLSAPPVAFTLRARITVAADRDPAKVLAVVRDVLRAQFVFAAREFGQGVALSEVTALMQNVPGVETVEVAELRRLGTPAHPQPAPFLPADKPARGIAAGEATAAELLILDETSLDQVEIAPP